MGRFVPSRVGEGRSRRSRPPKSLSCQVSTLRAPVTFAHPLVTVEGRPVAGYVKVVDPVAKSVSTLYQASLSHFRSLDVNEDNGNVLVCRCDVNGDLFEFDMVHRTLRTVKSGFCGLNGVDVEPAGREEGRTS